MKQKDFMEVKDMKCFGGANRDFSIEDGLVIFITSYDHRISKNSVHKDPKNKIWIEVKRIAQKTWQEYYKKTKEDFVKRYGKNYL